MIKKELAVIIILLMMITLGVFMDSISPGSMPKPNMKINYPPQAPVEMYNEYSPEEPPEVLTEEPYTC